MIERVKGYKVLWVIDSYVIEIDDSWYSLVR